MILLAIRGAGELRVCANDCFDGDDDFVYHWDG